MNGNEGIFGSLCGIAASIGGAYIAADIGADIAWGAQQLASDILTVGYDQMGTVARLAHAGIEAVADHPYMTITTMTLGGTEFGGIGQVVGQVIDEVVGCTWYVARRVVGK